MPEHPTTEEQRSAAGRALRALRPTTIYTCEVCGKEYPAQVRKASNARQPRFCSNRCRMKWRYQAQKQAKQTQ